MKLGSGTVIVGVTAIFFLIYEWDFGRRARTGEAEVIQSASYGRSGMTIADVVRVIDGQRVQVTLRAFYCLLSPGQQVRILYLPDDPENVVLDSFWQRYFGSIIALTFFAVLTVADVLMFRSWRRRQAVALLRDDYAGPRVVTRGMPALPIDTSPRLWDQQLDG